MTIGTSARVSFACDGTSKVFPVPIQGYQAIDFAVILTAPASAGGGETTLVLNSDYSLATSGTLSPTAWTLTTLAAAAYLAGYTLQVFINPVVSQQTQYVQGQQFPSLAIQTNFDRLTQMVQRIVDRLTRTVSVPDGDVNPTLQLPAAALRANTGLIFDANGNATVGTIPTVTFTQAMFNAFLGLATPYARTQAEITLGLIPVNILYPPGNALRWGADPTGIADSTVALQNWLDASYQTLIDAYLPGGTYTISAVLILNHSDQTNYRGRAFRVYGAGAGPVFVTPGSTGEGTSVIRSSLDTTLMQYQQYLGAVTTSGNYYVTGIRFEANSSVAAVQLDVLGEYSLFERNEIFQSGIGDGLRCLELTKGTIQYNNILNRDWNTAGLGAGRVGAGINIFSQYNAGLGTVRKNTCRGFKDAYVFGDGSHDLSALGVYDNECSVVYRGMTIGATSSKCALIHNYFEGVELTLITDLGRYSVVRDNISQGGTWTTGINGGSQGGGCIYDGNEIGLPPAQSNVTGITVVGTANLPCQVTNNQIIWGSSGTGLSNVIGIAISGLDAMIRHDGNMLNPNGGWAGASNCNAFVDNTTSSTSSGDGVRGFGQSQDSGTLFPRMARGAYGLWRNATALGNAAVSANVLTLTAATYHVVTCSSAQTVTSFSQLVAEEGHVYVIRFTNANVSLQNGTNLKLSGSANFTPGASGAIMAFIFDGNIAFEIHRTAF